MCGMIDLNTVNEDGDEPATLTLDSSSSTLDSGSDSGKLASVAVSSSSSSLCLELWHACAGPMISLPKKGSSVVYLPQGHLEHVSDLPAVAFRLPPHVFCRVLDVELHAEGADDEVYAKVSLLPDDRVERKWKEGKGEADVDEDDIEMAATTTPHMFCKTLTASDTSTHGGFSVPRRAAEDCFPPLDYKQQRPSQEIVAKDLYGIEWRFRHIYRGQPRRHLLTTGWSAFVNKKKLVSGDAVLFLRSGNGELRLGVRKATLVKNDTCFSALCSQQLEASTITSMVNAISKGCPFRICYNPRAGLSECMIPFRKFSNSLAHSFSAGMRFRMRFESEDAAERRYTGLITEISDVDPVRWPGSNWRCLLVRWDDLKVTRHRVSPWEIEPSCSVAGPSGFVISGTKRTRNGLPIIKPDFPVPGDGTGMIDFGESLRFQKVLQGQENWGFNNCEGINAHIYQPSEMRRGFPGSNVSRISPVVNGVRNLIGNSETSYEGIGFSESFRFNKVLQGQEAFWNPLCRRSIAADKVQENSGPGIIDGAWKSRSSNMWSALIPGYNSPIHQSGTMVGMSSASSVLMLSAPAPTFNALYSFNDNGKHESSSFDVLQSHSGKYVSSSTSEHSSRKEGLIGATSFGLQNEPSQLGFSNIRAIQSPPQPVGGKVSSCESSCRLFGFSLTETSHAVTPEGNSLHVLSPCDSESLFMPRGEEQLQSESPVVSDVVGSSCTKGSDIHAVRDTLLDIALALNGVAKMIAEVYIWKEYSNLLFKYFDFRPSNDAMLLKAFKVQKTGSQLLDIMAGSLIYLVPRIGSNYFLRAKQLTLLPQRKQQF
uniref:Auxin response factor n=1 Tax=Eucommia ulmoides TaxID=4392 RepID=A0A649UIM6_EUCUL|nr:ARF3.2 [Eucommia ulmoides]